MPNKTLTLDFGPYTITDGDIEQSAAKGPSTIKAKAGKLTLVGTTGGYTGAIEIWNESEDHNSFLSAGEVVIQSGNYALAMLAPLAKLAGAACPGFVLTF